MNKIEFLCVLIIGGLVALTFAALHSDHEVSSKGTKRVLSEAPTNTAAEISSQSTEKIFSSGQTILMKVTAYCPCNKCCGAFSDGKTSTGDNAKMCDGVAADPKLLPYRIKLFIPGAGFREVDDTGGAMRKSAKSGIYHIDLRMSSHEEARQWGVRKLSVIVYG